MKPVLRSLLISALLACLLAAQTLPGTKPLERQGDLAAQMVEGIDRYLMRATEAAALKRPAPDRERLRKVLGAVDPRVAFNALTLEVTSARSSLLATGPGYEVHAVRWPVLDGVEAEGLWLKPLKPPVANVIALPDADSSPEAIAGLTPDLPVEAQFARRLAENGCQVLAPVLIDRQTTWSGYPSVRYSKLTHREWIYRMAYEMGRHIIGYEIQKTLAAADWFEKTTPGVPIGVIGHDEGGLIALYSAALDPRIRAAGVSGYVHSPSTLWREPISRNVWGLLNELGGAGAPSGPAVPKTLPVLVGALTRHPITPAKAQPQVVAPLPDTSTRMKRQLDQLVDYTQKLVQGSPAVRARFWARADASSPEKWEATSEFYRRYLWEEIIGKLPPATGPLAAETRLLYDKPAFRGYEVLLPVYPDVFAYGILLLPKDLKPGQRRPVVVAQHGLEGRPQDLVEPGAQNAENAYHRFAAALAGQGYIVYAPQNPYIGGEKFRVLLRKAHPLKLSLFSFIIAQHQRTLDWLSEQPFVDPRRIGFYGLSYGGKTAMRVPAIEKRYALSICSGDFNEWIWKITSVDQPFSYMYTVEYDMLEFDLGHTMNYAEMAALIAPRPFMVERGHRDGVGIDEWVAYEYAKVRRFYTVLGLPDRTEIEFFNGPHTIHGVGTYEFLRKRL